MIALCLIQGAVVTFVMFDESYQMLLSFAFLKHMFHAGSTQYG